MQTRKGFTLIELVVSIGIFAVVTAIVFVNQKNFGGTIVTRNLAYDVALAIRQAQSYGISVKASGGSFNYSYGIHFGPPPRNTFVLFVDSDSSGSYNAGSDTGSSCIAGTECISFFKLQQGNTISSLCGGTDCAPSGSAINSLDILFRRPDPEPTIKGFLGTNFVGSYTNAFVTVSASSGTSRNVRIFSSGQISVE